MQLPVGDGAVEQIELPAPIGNEAIHEAVAENLARDFRIVESVDCFCKDQRKLRAQLRSRAIPPATPTGRTAL